MKDVILDNYREAGKLASAILREGAGRVRADTSIREYVESIESRVAGEGAALAFPLNVSINEAAAHDTASYDDPRVFLKGDVVKIDLGIQIEGFIADTATTVDLGKNTALVEASENALEAAIRKVAPGIQAGELGRAIQQEIELRRYRPVSNLTGHGLGQYILHRQPTIPNIAIAGGTVLEEGMVFAIEPFATTGSGHVREGTRTEIFSRISERPVRNPSARVILEKTHDRKGLPFARRWLNDRKLDLALPLLVRSGHLHAYPVLSDVQGSLVSQHEHTVIVTEDGCVVTTR
jgi:methionyl aminopeptidase